MRDPSQLKTKGGTPLIAVVTRALFALYFVVAMLSLFSSVFPRSKLTLPWVLYLFILYIVAERLYERFVQRGIDMTFAFPLLFAVFTLNLLSNLFGGQEEFLFLNRVEHFASFVLLAYVVSVFFGEYIPRKASRDHPYYMALLTLALTSLAGVGNEIIELLFDALFNTRHVGPGFDTSLDLLMNTLGSGLLLAVQLVAGNRFAR